MMDEFTFLEHWQKYTCNQESSEDIGSVEVASCDNPGWWVKINLKKTKFEHCAFEVISRNVSSDKHPLADDWLYCEISGSVYHGAGDPAKLKTILRIFIDWVEKNGGLQLPKETA